MMTGVVMMLDVLVTVVAWVGMTGLLLLLLAIVVEPTWAGDLLHHPKE